MFQRTDTPSKLDTELDRAFDALNEKNPGTDEYERAMNNVVTLHKMKAAEPQPDRVSYNTLVTVAANLIGIGLIIRHEHVNVITSKALSHIITPKNPQF